MARALVKTVGQGRRNYLINSNFDFWQRNTTFSAPGQFAYLADRWYNQSASNSGSVFQLGNSQSEFIAAGISGTNYASYLYNTTAPQLNLNQALEFPLVSELLGKTVTFSVYLKKNVANTRSYTIAIAKNATANTITGGSWSTIATTLIPNASLTSTMTRFSVTAAIPNDGTANGLKVMIYDNATGAAGDFIQIAQASLNIGSLPADYQIQGESIAEELAICQRYFEKSYLVSEPLGTASGSTGFFHSVAINTADFYDHGYVNYMVKKRVAATVSTWSYVGNPGVLYNLGTSTNQGNTGVRYQSQNGFGIYCNNNAMSATAPVASHWAADAELN